MTDNATANESTGNDATTDGDSAPDSDPDPAVVDALSGATVPLSTTDLAAPLDDLAPFGEAVADAEVVGLGEATHGSREFFDLKARFIRYCVEELGTRTIGFEANAGETLTVDEYVVHGEGDPEDALEAMYFWTWNTESVRDLLEWLRAFNEDRPLDDRVRFLGFDAQYTKGPVDRLREYFERVDPAFIATVGEDLETLADDGDPPHQDDELPARLAAGERVLPRVRERLDECREAYVDAADEEAWRFARRHLDVLDAVVARQETYVDADGESLVSGDVDVDEETIRVRETAMADGIDWLHEFDDGDGPLVCWAHDAHVAAADQRAGGVRSTAMGGYLRERHGDDYRPLGFTFGRGGLRAIGEVPPDEAETDDTPDDDAVHELRAWSFDGPLSGTVDAALEAAVDGPALLNCRRAADDDRLAAWLVTERPHHSTGATFDPETLPEHTKPYAPGEAFDVLVHLPEVTATRAP